MTTGEEPARHHNAFGFLRLALATLVIVSHVPELVDGDPHRELLFRTFGTETLGGVAVAGFFILSGFLVSSSYQRSVSVGDYLRKRIARIYPGFLACSLVCLLIVAPLVGGHAPQGRLSLAVASIARMLRLEQPQVPSVFHGVSGNLLIGPAWTIQYEFACYLLVVLLGLTGLLRRGWLMAVLSVGLLLGQSFLSLRPGDAPRFWLYPYVFQGAPRDLLRLPGMFLAGAAYRALQSRLAISRPIAAVAAVGLASALLSSRTVELGIGICGGYLLFAAARAGARTRLARINDATDISYGVYLYAFPVQQTLMLLGITALLPLGLATWGFASLCGLASWAWVEKPAALWARSRVHRVTPPTTAASAV